MKKIVVDMQNFLFADSIATAFKNSDYDIAVVRAESPRDTIELCRVFKPFVLLIPPNDKGTIIVYPSMITEDGEYTDDKSNPLHVGEPGEPLLLRCNLSEIYSNVLIAATDGGGAMDFRPSLSMENGHLQETAGVYDFSTYEEVPDERSIQIATELLLETEEVKQAVMQGMKVMYTGDTQWIEGRPCLLFALGTDSEEQFVRERYYGVCDNLVYSYDAISDTWSTVGRQ